MAGKTIKATKVSKVFVDKVEKRVVYAEADYTFIDILFSFMTLPMLTIVRLLGKLQVKSFDAFESLNNLYQSLVDFPECYLATQECKDLLLNPRSAAYDHCRYLKLKIDDAKVMKYFTYEVCVHDNFFFNVCNTTKCVRRGRLMKYYSPSVCNVSGDNGVIVSAITTFIVTDDLSVIPYIAEDCYQFFGL